MAQDRQLLLVTGAGGFIGSNLCFFLLTTTSFRVRALFHSEPKPESESDRRLTKLKCCLTESQSNRLDICIGSIEIDAARIIDNVDGVFHAAGKSHVSAPMDGCMQSNIVGTQLLLDAIVNEMQKRQTAIPLMFFSSSSLYKTQEHPLKEDEVQEPNTPYALSKQIGESICQYYDRCRGVPTVRSRIFLTYGEDEGTRTICGIFRSLVSQGKQLTINGDGSFTRDFVFVMDVVEACYRLMLKLLKEPESVRNQVFNIGTGHALSIKQLADLIRPQMDHLYFPPRPNDSPHSIADITALHNAIGWIPQTSIADWLKSSTK